MKAQPQRDCPRKMPDDFHGVPTARASNVTLMRCLVLLCLAGALSNRPLGAEVEIGRILVKNGTLFTLQADETSPRKGYLLAGEDGKILRVGYGDPPPG